MIIITIPLLQRQYSRLVTFKPATDNPNKLSSQLNDLGIAVPRGGKSAGGAASFNTLEADAKPKPDDVALELLRLRSTSTVAPTMKTTTSARPINSFKEFQKQQNEHDNDLKQLNDDLKLLSALLGRPISVAEIPSLVNQVGKSTAPSTLTPVTKPKTTRTTTPSTTTTTRVQSTTSKLPEVFDVAKYLQQNSQVGSTASASTSSPSVYGKSNEAVIAALLKEQGIGPENNKIPIDVRFCTPKE